MMVYFFIIFAWVLTILGLKLIKDYALTMIGAILILIIGVYGLANGINGQDNLVIFAFNVCHFFMGLYFLVRGSIEYLNKPVGVPTLNIWGRKTCQNLNQLKKRRKKKIGSK